MGYIQVESPKALRMKSCTAAQLNSDGTGTLANYTYIPFVEGTLNAVLEYPLQNPGHTRQYRDEENQWVLMPKKWKMTFSINLGPQTSRVGSGETTPQTPIGKILKLVMGGEKLAIGDTIKAATSPTTKSFEATTIARFAVGQVIAIQGSDLKLYMREIESITGDAITLKLALPNAPSAGAVIYGCATYYLDAWDSTAVTNAQFVLQGMSQSGGSGVYDGWVLLGGQCLTPPTIELPNNGIPRMTFTFEGPNWIEYEHAALNPAVTLATAVYSNVSEIAVADCEHLIPVVSTSTLTDAEHYVTDLTINPNFYYLKHESSGGTNGVSGYVMCAEHPKVTAQFTETYEDKTWVDGRDNRTSYAYFYQIGSSVTYGAILISMPRTQIVNWERIDMNGLMGQKITLNCRRDADVGSTKTAMAKTPFRIALV